MDLEALLLGSVRPLRGGAEARMRRGFAGQLRGLRSDSLGISSLDVELIPWRGEYLDHDCSPPYLITRSLRWDSALSPSHPLPQPALHDVYGAANARTPVG